MPRLVPPDTKFASKNKTRIRERASNSSRKNVRKTQKSARNAEKPAGRPPFVCPVGRHPNALGPKCEMDAFAPKNNALILDGARAPLPYLCICIRFRHPMPFQRWVFRRWVCPTGRWNIGEFYFHVPLWCRLDYKSVEYLFSMLNRSRSIGRWNIGEFYFRASF